MLNDKNDFELALMVLVLNKMIFQIKLGITDDDDYKKINNPNCAKYTPSQTENSDICKEYPLYLKRMQ